MKSKILIVEDQLITAQDLRSMLEAHKYSVVGIAQDGQQAIKAAYELKPDIVLMDIKLSDDDDEMSGTDAAAYIYSYYNIPIIFLTAYNDEETLIEAKNAEPLGYLNKPFKEQDVITTIEMGLFKHGKMTEIKQNESIFQTISQENQVGLLVLQTGIIKYVNPKFALILDNVESSIESWTANQLIDHLFSNELAASQTMKYDYLKFLQQYNQTIIPIKTSSGRKKNVHFSIKSLNYGKSMAELITIYETTSPKVEMSGSLDSSHNRKTEVSAPILNLTECFGNFDRFLVLDSIKSQKLGILELEVILGKSHHTVYKIIRYLNDRNMITSEKENGRTVYAPNPTFFNQFLIDWVKFESQFHNWHSN